jgi:hypothetical protein
MLEPCHPHPESDRLAIFPDCGSNSPDTSLNPSLGTVNQLTGIKLYKSCLRVKLSSNLATENDSPARMARRNRTRIEDPEAVEYSLKEKTDGRTPVFETPAYTCAMELNARGERDHTALPPATRQPFLSS